MPKRKEPELPPKEQFKRFVETAREHQVDETGQDLNRAFRKLTQKKPQNDKQRRGSADVKDDIQ